ncbi:hypothetical protein Pelo_14818 [Pelomyxa schiedti]|nr:hypothetical protein Pelo_14818 [Pelomyxa schiedti]
MCGCCGQARILFILFAFVYSVWCVSVAGVPENAVQSGPCDEAVAVDFTRFGDGEFYSYSGEVGSPRGALFVVMGQGIQMRAETCIPEGAFGVDTVIDVYKGCPTSFDTAKKSSNLAIMNDDACGLQSIVVWFAEARREYFLLVHSFRQERGPFTFKLGYAEVQPHWSCDTAFAINFLPFVDTGTTSFTPPSSSDCSAIAYHALWYKIEGNGEEVLATTCGQGNFDTVLEVYSACSNNYATSCVTQNDDFCGTQSLVSFRTSPGKFYYVLVGGYSNDILGGNFTFAMDYVRNMQNDICWTSENISLPYKSSQSTVSCGYNPPGKCSHSSTLVRGRWFTFITGKYQQLITIVSSSTEFSPEIEVYSSCSLWSCVEKSITEKLTFTAEENRQYYLFISGLDSAGVFELQVFLENGTLSSQCDSPSEIHEIPFVYEGSTKFSTFSPSGFGNQEKQGMWFSIVGTGANLSAHTCSSHTNFDTVLELHTSCPDGLTGNSLMAMNDDHIDSDGCSHGRGTSRISWKTEKGQLYYIFLTGFGTDSGVFVLVVGTELTGNLSSNGKEGTDTHTRLVPASLVVFCFVLLVSLLLTMTALFLCGMTSWRRVITTHNATPFDYIELPE